MRIDFCLVEKGNQSECVPSLDSSQQEELNDHRWVREIQRKPIGRFAWTSELFLNAQKGTLHRIILVCDPESVLPDVLAIHTIEMIPKSMILEIWRNFQNLERELAAQWRCLTFNWVKFGFEHFDTNLFPNYDEIMLTDKVMNQINIILL